MTHRLILLVTLAMLPAAALLAWNARELWRSREAEVHEQALRQAQLAASEIRQILDGVRNLLIAVAEVPAVRDLALPACAAYFATLTPKVSYLASLAALDREGRLVCHSGRASSAGMGALAAPYLDNALLTGGFVVDTYAEATGDGGPTLPLAVPLTDARGRRVGVVVAALDLRWLGRQLRERALAVGGSVTVADRDGVILAREPMAERFVGTRIPDAFQHLVRADHPGSLEVTSQDGTRRVLGYVPSRATPGGIYVSAGLSSDRSFAAVSGAEARSVALTALGLLLALAGAAVVGNRFIHRPVQALAAAAARWRAGDYTVRVGGKVAPVTGELGELAAAFDGMVEEIARREAERQTAWERQRLLLKELSHRVKNTLATVQAIAARSLSGNRSLEEGRQILVQRLRALAATHDLLIANGWQGAKLRELVRAELAPYGPRAAITGADLVLSPRAAQTLGLILHELATNAAKHGALSVPDGQVAVGWNVVADGFRFDWREIGGPPVETPARHGFGRMLVEGMVAHELAGEACLQFDPAGVAYRLEAPRASIAG